MIRHQALPFIVEKDKGPGARGVEGKNNKKIRLLEKTALSRTLEPPAGKGANDEAQRLRQWEPVTTKNDEREERPRALEKRKNADGDKSAASPIRALSRRFGRFRAPICLDEGPDGTKVCFVNTGGKFPVLENTFRTLRSTYVRTLLSCLV